MSVEYDAHATSMLQVYLQERSDWAGDTEAESSLKEVSRQDAGKDGG